MELIRSQFRLTITNLPPLATLLSVQGTFTTSGATYLSANNGPETPAPRQTEVCKEAPETLHWLRLLAESDIVPLDCLQPMMDE
jgi:hypothetical protein